MIAFTMTKVEIDVPEEIVPYIVSEDKEVQITGNAMLVCLSMPIQTVGAINRRGIYYTIVRPLLYFYLFSSASIIV